MRLGTEGAQAALQRAVDLVGSREESSPFARDANRTSKENLAPLALKTSSLKTSSLKTSSLKTSSLKTGLRLNQTFANQFN
ncbi:hypothetical protein FF011L_34030 [Roseimaritima multifibrata]|uniref:Uncharacterized protein n=1 Tax=Roseimaritima multifibrata TaxID=1930274 RepID=A0A517MIC1_9BACT|nr:hypothetical protein FF011L_34030 [Roseimaritima multifibrata]